MIGIIRYLRGYVKIRVWGYAPERFMNLCTGRGIVLWGLAGSGGCYTMYLTLSDFFLIRDMVKKTKIRVAVLERHGLPFFMRDARKRKAFFLGVACCLCFLFVMSRFVWAIEFVGNERITEDELTDFLREQGVSYGMRRSALDPEALEAALRETFPQITWTSLRLDGCRITVQIRENELPTLEEQAGSKERFPQGADLTAARSGIVRSILTRAGVPQVKEGDRVERGDVLISGLVPVTNDDGTVREWQRTAADGDVVLEYTGTVSLRQPFSYTYRNYTGREKKYFFFTLFDRRYRFPFTRCRYVRYDEVIQQERVRLLGQIDLPLSAGTVLCREYLPVDALYDAESAKELLAGDFQKFISGLEEKGVHIIQKDVKIIENEDALLLQGQLTMQQEAVLLRPVQTVPEASAS